jgi:type IV pilus assembly protein PilZ
MSDNGVASERKGNNIFFIHYKDKTDLYAHYMPFIKNGAVFVPTEMPYGLGDEVFLMIKLIDEQEKFTIKGQVVWITPTCAQGGKLAGIGVQFVSEEAEVFKRIVETYLAGSLQSERFTETL